MLSEKVKDFTIRYLNEVYVDQFLPQQSNIVKKVSSLQVITFNDYAIKKKDQIVVFISTTDFEDVQEFKNKLLKFIAGLLENYLFTTDEQYNDFIKNIFYPSLLHNMTSFTNMLINYEKEIG